MPEFVKKADIAFEEETEIVIAESEELEEIENQLFLYGQLLTLSLARRQELEEIQRAIDDLAPNAIIPIPNPRIPNGLVRDGRFWYIRDRNGIYHQFCTDEFYFHMVYGDIDYEANTYFRQIEQLLMVDEETPENVSDFNTCMCEIENISGTLLFKRYTIVLYTKSKDTVFQKYFEEHYADAKRRLTDLYNNLLIQ